jgi:hypothetical protein
MPSDHTEQSAAAGSRREDDGGPIVEAEVIEISSYRRSRYERNGRSLPHLGDDPDWTPTSFELPTPISDEGPQRWFDRFRR